MKINEAIIKKGEWLLDALKRIGYDLIPTNTILDKTLTGLGATHSEIHSKRNSIIIEPNVTVILGKLNNNENLEAVYEKYLPYNIKKYLSPHRLQYIEPTLTHISRPPHSLQPTKHTDSRL